MQSENIIDLSGDEPKEEKVIYFTNDPVIKQEFPPGSLVKISVLSIIKNPSKYNCAPDFYAIVAKPKNEHPSHIPLPEDKTCAIIGVVGFKNWTDKRRQNVIVKIMNNSELTLILGPGQTLEGISMKLSKKSLNSSCGRRRGRCCESRKTYAMGVVRRIV